MPNSPLRRNALTPDALQMMDIIARTGSFAAAARELGRVPSALTYSVRQLEDALDVLLFDRSSRQAQLTAAGQRPWPRVDLGMALLTQRLAHAAIDVSDGLLADLGHIAKRSRLEAEVFLPQLPGLPAGAEPLLARSCQLAGGDDYELVFAAAPGQRHELAELASRLDLPLWRIGRMIEATDESPGEAAGPGRCPSAGNVIMLDENGQPVPATEKGYDHFAQDTP